MRTLDDVNLDDYDFFDFGASTGGSLQRCETTFGGRGLGIDINPRKVEAATANGADVVLGEITKLPPKKLVRYVCMDNFLEHLPNFETVSTMLSVASEVATDFLYIKHPSFEDEPYLRALGLKQYWHDWTGHPSHIMISDFADMLGKVGAMPIELRYLQPAWDSSDPSVLPLDAPIDQHRYDPKLHGPKPHVEFDRPMHWQIEITAYLGNKVDNQRLAAEVERLKSRRAVQVATALWWVRNGQGWQQRRAGLRGLVKTLAGR